MYSSSGISKGVSSADAPYPTPPSSIDGDFVFIRLLAVAFRRTLLPDVKQKWRQNSIHYQVVNMFISAIWCSLWCYVLITKDIPLFLPLNLSRHHVPKFINYTEILSSGSCYLTTCSYIPLDKIFYVESLNIFWTKIKQTTVDQTAISINLIWAGITNKNYYSLINFRQVQQTDVRILLLTIVRHYYIIHFSDLISFCTIKLDAPLYHNNHVRKYYVHGMLDLTVSENYVMLQL